MFKNLSIGLSLALPLGLIAVANPEHLGEVGHNIVTQTAIKNLYNILGVDLSGYSQSITIVAFVIAISLILAIASYLVMSLLSNKNKQINKNIKLIFDTIENGRTQITILETALRDRKFGNIHVRTFEKLGHTRRIMDALEHRARQFAPYYHAINTGNRDDVIELFEKPLKFSVSCVNSLRDTQAIEVIPDILPLESIVKLDLFFNSIRREIEEHDALALSTIALKNADTANQLDESDIEEDEGRLPEVIAA